MKRGKGRWLSPHPCPHVQAFDGDMGLARAGPLSEGGWSEVYFWWILLTRSSLSFGRGGCVHPAVCHALSDKCGGTVFCQQWTSRSHKSNLQGLSFSNMEAVQIGDWISKLWCNHTMEYYTALQRNCGCVQRGWISDVMLSERRDMYILFDFIYVTFNSRQSQSMVRGVGLAVRAGWGLLAGWSLWWDGNILYPAW